MIYLVDNDTLEIKASVNGLPDNEDLQKQNLVAIESYYDYSPLQVKAEKSDNKIIIYPRPYLELNINYDDTVFRVNIQVKKVDGSLELETSGTVFLCLSKVNSDRIIEEKISELKDGYASIEIGVPADGAYILNAKHDEYSKTDMTIVIENGEVV